jgi:hypothetical protein
MTLTDKIGNVIRGEHVMGDDGLRDYHRIQAVKSDMRIRDRFIRFASIKATLNPYRVMVSFTADEKVRVYAPSKQVEVIL